MPINERCEDDVNDAQQHVTLVGVFGICYEIWAMAI